MHHGLDDAAATRLLWRSLLVVAAVTLVTAWFSDLYYFPDEHYQVLEFMSRKLGTTAAHDMRWEYFAQIRSWMQPFLYYLIAKPLILVGIKDLFVITFVLRLATGLLSVAALALFARELLPTLEGRAEKLAFAGYLLFFGFLPYLFVRTASETMSAAFFTLGLALVLRSKSASRALWAGLLCGLAFDTRYQSGILIAALWAWLALVARLRPGALAAFAGGVLGAIAAGSVVDRWGYGVWRFTPWLYFKVNILEGVAAKNFGADPVLAYFYMLPAQFFFAITLVLVAAMLMMWLRRPWHVLTWVTLPFFLIHMALGHKEARFMFPLVIMATAFPVLGFSPGPARWRGMAERLWGWRASVAARIVTAISVFGMVMLAVYPLGLRPHMPMAKYVYRHFAGGISAYSFDAEPFISYPMYRPAGFHLTRLQTEAQLESLLQKGPVYLFANTPTLAVLPADARAQVLYSEFPLEGLGYGAWGTRYMAAFAKFSAWAKILKMPPLAWVTLYRLDRATRS